MNSKMLLIALLFFVGLANSIFAKSIVIHQNTKIIWVPFVQLQNNSVIAFSTNQNDLDYSIKFWEF